MDGNLWVESSKNAAFFAEATPDGLVCERPGRHSPLASHERHVIMSDAKKRPHDGGGDFLEPSSEENAPAAKRPKIIEDEGGLGKDDATEPKSADLGPPVTPAALLGACTDAGTRYGELNQDSYFMERILLANGYSITVLAVFDGHGKHGEKASKLASDFFQAELLSYLRQAKHAPMREHEVTIKNIFKGAHDRIIQEYELLTTLHYDGYNFNLMMTADRVDFYSSPTCPYVLLQDFGTTAVVCIYWEEFQKLMVANCGDSDALIGRWDAVTKQLLPNLLAINDNVSCESNGEQERIQKAFGRKTKFGGGYLSPNDATYGFHSLAMTRALGHKFLEKYGVTWEPHVRFFQITPEDVVLIVASDGLFDVVNNKAILSIAGERHPVGPKPRTLTPTESSSRLVQLALDNWKRQFGSGDVADNTTVCVFKLSSQFDAEVPIRDLPLSDSGTAFSPELTSVHALEAEIEETSKDILAAPTDQTPDPTSTPILLVPQSTPLSSLPLAPPPSLASTRELPIDTPPYIDEPIQPSANATLQPSDNGDHQLPPSTAHPMATNSTSPPSSEPTQVYSTTSLQTNATDNETITQGSPPHMPPSIAPYLSSMEPSLASATEFFSTKQASSEECPTNSSTHATGVGQDVSSSNTMRSSSVSPLPTSLAASEPLERLKSEQFSSATTLNGHLPVPPQSESTTNSSSADPPLVMTQKT